MALKSFKLWREDGSAGGYYTVALEYRDPSLPYSGELVFTCRANDSWDDLSDEC